MPKAKIDKIRIAAVLNTHSSIALAFLLQETFARANRLLGWEQYDVRFVTADGARTLAASHAVIPTEAARGQFRYVIVTPLDGVGFDYRPSEMEVNLIRTQHRKGAVVASACLGALTLAEAGLLNGRQATTHWAWKATVKDRFPLVNWDVSRMICDLKDVITAGGYLAVIDLTLYIVASTSSRGTAHRLGQTLLADSIRQKQSVYAHSLIDSQVEHPQFGGLTRWIERNLSRPITIAVMARRCGMSSRNFHRSFLEAYGVTPRKFIQVKRIEKTQELLRNTSRSLEQILHSVGVADPTSFRRVFQRELGHTPAEYRRKLSAQLDLREPRSAS